MYDPIERGYLDGLEFTIYEFTETEKILIEQYVLKIKWTESGYPEIYISLSKENRNKKKKNQNRKLITKHDIERQFKRFAMRMFTLNNCLEAIPINSSYSIQLYYNKTTPNDYAPPKGFRNADENDNKFNIPKNTSLIEKNIGKITANRFEYSMKFKTRNDHFYDNQSDFEDDEERNPSTPMSGIFEHDYDQALNQNNHRRRNSGNKDASDLVIQPPRKKRKNAKLKVPNTNRITTYPPISSTLTHSVKTYKRGERGKSNQSVPDEIIARWFEANPDKDVIDAKEQFPETNLPKIMRVFNQV